MKLRSSWFWLGAAVVLIAALAALGSFLTPHAGPSDEPGAQARKEAALVLRWREGSSQQYAVRMDSSFRMNTTGAGATQPGQSIGVRFEGTLVLRTLEVDASQAVVGMRLSSAGLQVSGASDAATNLALATPFRVRFGAAGLPTTFEFPAGLSAEHRGVIENLIRTFQVAVQQGSQWTVQESNANGVYEAAYARTGTSQLDKRKLRFVGTAPATPGSPGSLAEISSKEQVRIDAAHDWIADMQVDETVRSGDPGGLVVDVTNHATLVLQPGTAVPSTAALEAWRFVAAAPPAAATAAPGASAALPRAQAEKQLRADLAALDAAKDGRSVLVNRLRDLIRSDGQLAFTLLDEMRAQKLNDRTRADLFLVLELAGSSRAQDALRSVIGDSAWAPADGRRAIIALGGVARPTAETVGALWSLARSADASSESHRVAGIATLALGSAGNRLIAAEDPSYASVRANLLFGALDAAEPQQRANFIHALANTGDASLSQDIVPLLDDPAPAVRSAAAQSLGTLGTDRSAEVLVARLTQERVGVVRGAIAGALVSWSTPTPEALASIRTAVQGEHEEAARFAMAQILGQSLAAFPENRAVLTALMKSEQSERIRRQVAGLLAAGR